MPKDEFFEQMVQKGEPVQDEALPQDSTSGALSSHGITMSEKVGRRGLS